MPGWQAAQKIPEHKRYSKANIAMIMGTTVANVEKTLRLGPNPTAEEEAAVRWTKGRPRKSYPMTNAGMTWLLSDVTLQRQAGMSLEERCYAFNAQWSVGIDEKEQLKVWQLRAYYRGGGITLQKVVPRLGRPVLENLEVQAINLEQVKAKVQRLIDQGYDVFQLDESTFNANAYPDRAWAKIK